MAKKPFKASKVRQRKEEPTFVIGPQLNPSYADQVWYTNEIRALIFDEVARPHFKQHGFTGDKMLSVNFMDVLKKKAYGIAKKMASKVNKHSSRTTWDAIEALGKETLSVGLAPVDALIQQQIETNVGLITNLAQDTSNKITELYKKYGPDQAKIYPELKEMVGNRAKLIGRDQNAKMFTSLNTTRMLEAGIKTFIWDHSSAGKTPRPCHVDRDGKEFSLDGGPEVLNWPDGTDANGAFGGKKGDAGKPGWAINCRCRMRPKASLDD